MSRLPSDVQDERLRTTVLSLTKTVEEQAKTLSAQAEVIASQEKRAAKLEKRAQRRLEKLKAANARIESLQRELIGYQNMLSPDRPETRLEGQRAFTVSPLTNPGSPTGSLPTLAVNGEDLPIPTVMQTGRRHNPDPVQTAAAATGSDFRFLSSTSRNRPDTASLAGRLRPNRLARKETVTEDLDEMDGTDHRPDSPTP